MTFEITQLWGQITGSSLQVQMFTSEPQTLRSAPLFLYGPTTLKVHKDTNSVFGPSGWTTFICTFSGSIYVGPDQKQQKVEPPHTVVFGDGDSVKIQNNVRNRTLEFPIFCRLLENQSISQQHGPFVMTTEEEVEQAIRDYQRGQNGFQRAINWRSKIRVSS
ncbi:pirin [Echeneis naucrates]|uniref:pirin n=1 Tax=Echeneis naucrates TaxID=173247 RepID=UPI001113E6D8|nr:pirin [Echeneis naucrates]